MTSSIFGLMRNRHLYMEAGVNQLVCVLSVAFIYVNATIGKFEYTKQRWCMCS